MKMFKYVSILIVALTLSGCGKGLNSSNITSYDDWQKQSTRSFNAVKPVDVYKATQQIFTLSDKAEDVSFTYRKGGMDAVRRAISYPRQIFYYWHIDTIETDGGVEVTASITTKTISVVYGGPDPYYSDDVVNLYFNRLSYLLGQSNKWESCAQYESAHPNGSSLEPLCLHAEDSSPE